jgi:plastocyanin
MNTPTPSFTPSRTLRNPEARRSAPVSSSGWCRLVLAASLALPAYSFAADPEFLLTIKNHRFEPAELKLPAGSKVKLIVHNQDSAPEEFESKALNREKIVPPGGKVTIFVGPLKPGRYEFVGEYNEATAKGVIVVE